MNFQPLPFYFQQTTRRLSLGSGGSQCEVRGNGIFGSLQACYIAIDAAGERRLRQMGFVLLGTYQGFNPFEVQVGALSCLWLPKELSYLPTQDKSRQL